MKISELPVMEQPRERLVNYGVENLSNSDLISIILRSGIKNYSVKDISNNILNQVGSINNLSTIGLRELANIKGVGSVSAMSLLASIELGKRVSNVEPTIRMKLNNSFKVHEAFKQYFINLSKEKLMAIFLDNKKCLISYKIISVGTNNKTLISQREIFNEAIKCNAHSFILIHNHPSGDIMPSKEDKEITSKIKLAGEMLGIYLIDHLITNGGDYYSFFEKIFEE